MKSIFLALSMLLGSSAWAGDLQGNFAEFLGDYRAVECHTTVHWNNTSICELKDVSIEIRKEGATEMLVLMMSLQSDQLTGQYLLGLSANQYPSLSCTQTPGRSHCEGETYTIDVFMTKKDQFVGVHAEAKSKLSDEKNTIALTLRKK